MTLKQTITTIFLYVAVTFFIISLNNAYHTTLQAEYHQGYSDGYAEGYSVPIDQTGAQKHINEQIKRILDDDKLNPLCGFYMDEEGHGHGCLTDEQLDAIIELDTFVNNEM